MLCNIKYGKLMLNIMLCINASIYDYSNNNNNNTEIYIPCSDTKRLKVCVMPTQIA